MLNVNSDIQSMRFGASAATATSGINQPEVTSALDLQLVKSLGKSFLTIPFEFSFSPL